MGVFSRTMLMLTLAWLVGLCVTFIYMSNSSEPSWRDKMIAEANITRALAYRLVDVKGGTVASGAHEFEARSDEQPLPAESIGAPPYGGQTAGTTDPLPGAKVARSASLIELERNRAQGQITTLQGETERLKEEIEQRQAQIRRALQDRRAQEARFADVAAATRNFAGTMDSYRHIVAVNQMKVFNLDLEIHRVLIEKDALTAELAQIQNDIRRIDGQAMSIEDSYYELSRAYERTIRILAWYEQTDPNLRLMADTAGRGWLRGRVVSVGDDPRTGVVSISIGSHEGVKVGQVFSISRGDQFIGRMVVETVRPNVSMGRLLEEFRGRALVAEGDNVKTAETFGGTTLGR